MRITIIRRVAAVCLLGCLATFTGCSQSAESTAEDADPSAIPTRVVDADLSSGAVSLRSLARTANALVVARAGEARVAENPVDPQVVTTTQDFTVVSSAWGSLNRDEVIKVSFTGGLVTTGRGAPYVLELEGQPQFTGGEEYMLALLGPAENGTYMILGGPQGRFHSAGGVLRAEAAASSEDPVVQGLNGQPAEAAIAQLGKLRR